MADGLIKLVKSDVGAVIGHIIWDGTYGTGVWRYEPAENLSEIDARRYRNTLDRVSESDEITWMGFRGPDSYSHQAFSDFGSTYKAFGLALPAYGISIDEDGSKWPPIPPEPGHTNCVAVLEGDEADEHRAEVDAVNQAYANEILVEILPPDEG
jgi:hypothetical protein